VHALDAALVRRDAAAREGGVGSARQAGSWPAVRQQGGSSVPGVRGAAAPSRRHVHVGGRALGKALCSGWDWHQSEGMAKLTTSLNAFFKTRKSAKRLETSPFAGFPYVRGWSAYPPKLSVTADVPARQPVPIAEVGPTRSPRRRGRAPSLVLSG